MVEVEAVEANECLHGLLPHALHAPKQSSILARLLIIWLMHYP